ncbi:MAG TPA: sigma-54 dependent transcriptional regulator [Pseudomonadales bacterium]
MKILDEPPAADSPQSALSYGALLEKIEIMRSSLRWPQSLDRTQIQKLFNQTNALRDEVLRLSRTERFLTAKTRSAEEAKRPVAERRRALLDRQFRFEGVFGDNPKLIEALEIAEKAAPTDLPVLIDGESGTGKELMAKVIHANGNRADGPFVTVNCGAIPENLIESELFGHRKGAFTGASADRAGKFESANGGTIFLDEIGELPLAGQVKLLRVLQSNEIQRVGSDQPIKVDARIVAATNRRLHELCREGAFREDLYYRLSIIQVTLPPLRERRDEIPLLIDYLTQEAAERLGREPVRLSRRLDRFLNNYDYPGNIRELRNLVFRITCLAGAEADIEHLPEHIRPSGSSAPASSPTGPTTPLPTEASLAEAKRIASDEAERRFLEAGLIATGGNVTRLAQQIDMNRAHVQTLLKKHGLSSKDFRGARTGNGSGVRA